MYLNIYTIIFQNKPENPFQNYDVAKKFKKAMRQNVYKILKGTIEKPSKRVTKKNRFLHYATCNVSV